MDIRHRRHPGQRIPKRIDPMVHSRNGTGR